MTTIAGVVISFLLVGIISIAGKLGNAPTMILTRAIFGVEGAKVPATMSWIATLGWEISLTTMAILAASSTIEKLGWGSGASPKIISTLVIIGLVVVAGIYGYDLIMRLQQIITMITAVVIGGFSIIGWGNIDFSGISSARSGSLPAMLGCCFFAMTGFGLGWVNIAADYSRHLPHNASNTSIVVWTTFSASIANIFLIVYGLLLAVSNKVLADNVGNDPIGAMASILPTWYLIPFTIVAVLGLIAGVIMDNYSNGLALLSFGIKLLRTLAAAITSVLTVIGVVYVTFFSSTFIGPFQGFLITLGIPMASWGVMFVADILLRRKDYDTTDIYRSEGRYGSWNITAFATLAIAAFLGWGLVVNSSASWLNWQRYLLAPSEARTGPGRQQTWVSS